MSDFWSREDRCWAPWLDFAGQQRPVGMRSESPAARFSGAEGPELVNLRGCLLLNSQVRGAFASLGKRQPEPARSSRGSGQSGRGPSSRDQAIAKRRGRSGFGSMMSRLTVQACNVGVSPATITTHSVPPLMAMRSPGRCCARGWPGHSRQVIKAASRYWFLRLKRKARTRWSARSKLTLSRV